MLAAVAAWPSAAGAQARAIGDTRVFAKVPDPGQPAGIVVDQGRVLVSTAGVFQPSMDPRLFVYDLAARKLSASHDIPLDHAQMGAVGQHPVMTFFGVADDAAGRAYVVDMNGRIIRVDPVTGRHEDYATFPASVGGLSTMPFDIAFDDPGNAYVTDQNTASIWRVPPGGGTPKIWFQDPRLAGYLFGASGIRLDPQGRYVYFTVSLSQYPETSNAGVVYRLPLVDHPTAAQLQEVYRYPSGSMPFGIAFGASGKLYVALAGLDQVSILQPSGSGPAMKEAKVFPSAEENSSRDVPYEDPMSVAFDGCGSLLVTNSTALTPPSNPAHWAIFDAWVGDTAAPMARPALPGAAPLPVHSPPCAPPAVKPPPLPTLRCLARYLPLDATGIGAVRIGETRRRMLGLRPGPVRRTRKAYRWCVDGSTGAVTAVFGKGGRSLLVTSTASRMTASALRRAFPRHRAIVRGVWRLSSRSGRIAGVRGGRVRFVGVADRSLLGKPKLLRRRLRSAGL